MLLDAKGCGVVVDVKSHIRMEGVLCLGLIFPVCLVVPIVAGVEGDIRPLTLFSERGDTRHLQLFMAFFIFHLLVFMILDEFAGIPESLIIIIRFSYLIKFGGISGPP